MDRGEAKAQFSITSRIIASLLIALSGFVLYLDKVFIFFNVSFTPPEKFIEAGVDFDAFLWFLAQTISPFLLIIGSILRPYNLAYMIPIYCYTLQLYFILFDYNYVDYDYIGIYSVGTSVLLVFIIIGIKTALHYLFQKKLFQIKKELKEKIRDAKK